MENGVEAPVVAAHDGDLAELQAAAKAGEPAAQLELGKRMLVGKGAPFAPEEGLGHVRAAAGAQQAGAFAVLATLNAAGAWVPQSWERSLSLLARAAGLGSADAAEQLALIEAGSLARPVAPPPSGREALQALLDRIDLERFVQPPQRQQVCEAPRIWRADGFATPAECAWLRARAAGKLEPAKMYDRQRQQVGFTAIRSNSDHFFDVLEGGVLLVLLRIRISLLVSLPLPHFEPPQMLHYAPGQELKAHYDNLRENEAGYGKDGAYDGDRVVTFLLYLNEGYEGGETEFVKAEFVHKGAPGDAIFFANLRDGAIDRMALHCGRPIVSGEKWLLSQWIHDRPFTATME